MAHKVPIGDLLTKFLSLIVKYVNLIEIIELTIRTQQSSSSAPKEGINKKESTLLDALI
ncbi:hypothetical protein ACIQAA_16690 [Neobacillus sp. NPDC093182]|uniref:hypothetical protein n=1 Tax=Neobacillus sp. NPDC093182 TaxID=3364297 RepID=UPI003807C912